MSNNIGLYCGDLQAIVEKLGSYNDDVENDENYEFPFQNVLGEDEDTDYPLQDLGQLVEGKKKQLDQAALQFLKSFIWDWIDEKPVYDMKVDSDELGVNAIISNATLKSMNLDRINVEQLGKTLFASGVCWETTAALTDYLSIWHKAYCSARDKGEGIVLKVWV